MENKSTPQAVPVSRHITYGELENMSTQSILRQCLTLDSITTAPSSYFERLRSFQGKFKEHGMISIDEEAEHEMIEIGEGLQGAVFEQSGRSEAVKKEKPGNEHKSSSLQREYHLHDAVCEAFEDFSSVFGPEPQVLVPSLHSFRSCGKTDLSKFPDRHRHSGNLLSMDRILPLTKAVRRALISQFYPRTDREVSPTTVEGVLECLPNKHALARTYFGKQSQTFTKSNFSLRNFPLCLELMEGIGMDTQKMVRMMGRAFAIMHWGAGVDGDDVEFVLGTYLAEKEDQNNGTQNLQHRALGYYLLDFGQCSFVDLAGETHAVYQAFKGAMVTGDNQYFIPHCTKSPALFAAFKQAYIEAGKKILAHKGMGEKFSMEEFMAEYEEYVEDFLL